MIVKPYCTNTLPILRELLLPFKPFLKSSWIHTQYLKSMRADALSNFTSSVTTFEGVMLSVQVKSRTPQAFRTTLNVIFTLNCQSPTHWDINMERQFCKRLSQQTIIVGDYPDLKHLGVWAAELEFAIIQPPTGRECKVIAILKEIKMKKQLQCLISFPISFTEIKNLWHKELWTTV